MQCLDRERKNEIECDNDTKNFIFLYGKVKVREETHKKDAPCT